MGVIKTIALVILGISGFVFVALFGRLPAFRKTPIGFLHRLICIHIPNGIFLVDSYLLGGRLTSCSRRSGNYILHENHPLVLIFFSTLLVVGQGAFIPSAWPRVSAIHRLCIPVLAVAPYILLYLSVVTKPYITPENHAEEMEKYPYDRVIFHPGYRCRSCQFLKPARSKHCSYCKACVSRHDHHCIWLTNCVGSNNYKYFLSLIMSLSVMLFYGAALGYSILCQTWENLVPAHSVLRRTKLSWTTSFNVWSYVVAMDVRVGAVFLLMSMTAPLALAFLVYHTYLIWAGMTTNESAKWSDWKEDIADGMVYKSTKGEIFGNSPRVNDHLMPQSTWPVSSEQVIGFTEGEPPRKGFRLCADSNDINQPESPEAALDPRWTPVRSIREVDNIYDLGFWNNIRHVFGLSVNKKLAHH